MPHETMTSWGKKNLGLKFQFEQNRWWAVSTCPKNQWHIHILGHPHLHTCVSALLKAYPVKARVQDFKTRKILPRLQFLILNYWSLSAGSKNSFGMVKNWNENRFIGHFSVPQKCAIISGILRDSLLHIVFLERKKMYIPPSTLSHLETPTWTFRIYPLNLFMKFPPIPFI